MNTTNFSFTQKVDGFGFNLSHQTTQNKVANDRRDETHYRTDYLKQEGGENQVGEKGTFWTVCPYCYHMYEYEEKYVDCCLLCQNCKKGFHGLPVAAPPERFSMKGDVGEYHLGYGFFRLAYFSGDAFLSKKKQVDEAGNVGIKRVVVEISDDSDEDEKKGMDSRNECWKRGGNKRVKSVPRNSKKKMGRGVKVSINEDIIWNEEEEKEANIDCGFVEVDGLKFEGIEDIFLDLGDIFP